MRRRTLDILTLLSSFAALVVAVLAIVISMGQFDESKSQDARQERERELRSGYLRLTELVTRVSAGRAAGSEMNELSARAEASEEIVGELGVSARGGDYRLLASVFRALGRPAEARDLLTISLKSLDPEDIHALMATHRELGAALFDLGRPDEAAHEYRKAIGAARRLDIRLSNREAARAGFEWSARLSVAGRCKAAEATFWTALRRNRAAGYTLRFPYARARVFKAFALECPGRRDGIPRLA